MYHTTPGDGTKPFVLWHYWLQIHIILYHQQRFLHVDFVNSGRSFMKIVNKTGRKIGIGTCISEKSWYGN